MKFIKQSYMLSHVRLKHQYCPNFQITCNLGCGKTFKVFSSFTSHLSKTHSKGKIVRNSNVSLCCCHCTYVCSKLSELVLHFEDHMKTGISVECPIANCNKSYNLKSSLKSHIWKIHRFDKTVKSNLCHKLPHFPYRTTTVTENATEIKQVLPDDNLKNLEVASCNENIEDYDRQFALFFLQMQAKYHIPDSTVTFLADGFKNLMTLQSSLWLRSLPIDISNFTPDLKHTLEASILNSDFFPSMSTSHNRMKYYEKYFQFLKPETYCLGRNKTHTQCSFQYVSIIKSLSQLLQHNDINQQVFKNRNSANGIFKDFTDGSFFKTNVVLSSQTFEKTLVLLLYFDEFCIVNPIGTHCKNHKIASFYYLLGNLDCHNRSTLNLIQLSILCRTRDLKYFGLKAVLHPLIRDLKILASDGLIIPGVGHLTASVSFVCGDNLGSHYLGGFMECFSPNIVHVCRTCMITSEEIQQNFDVETFLIRTPAMYDAHANAVFHDRSKCSDFGIKMNSPLNEIPNFHVVTGLPPDAMHDILEGIAPYEIVLILKKLISENHFTLDYLNRRILTFPYGKLDAISKPVEQNLSKNTLTGTASSNWCFLRLLPLFVGSLIPKDNEYWNFFLELKSIVELIFAPVISIGHIDSLQSDIVDHFKKFKLLFPANRLKPKHHFLLHYPRHILNFGPPIRYWCFRFEAKHRFFKEVARYSKQFRNPPLTLAKHHQLFQSFCHQSDQGFLKSEFQCFGSEPITFADVNAAAIERIMSATHSDNTILYQAKTVTIRGTSYALEMFLVAGFINGSVIFGKICKIIIFNENSWFLIRKYESKKLPHFGCYQLEPLDIYDCFQQHELVDVYPLSSYTIFDTQPTLVIAPKHFLFDERDFALDV